MGKTITLRQKLLNGFQRRAIPIRFNISRLEVDVQYMQFPHIFRILRQQKSQFHKLERISVIRLHDGSPVIPGIILPHQPGRNIHCIYFIRQSIHPADKPCFQPLHRPVQPCSEQGVHQNSIFIRHPLLRAFVRTHARRKQIGRRCAVKQRISRYGNIILHDIKNPFSHCVRRRDLKQ